MGSYYDPYDADYDEPLKVTCKFCGEEGLVWEELDEGWRLIDANDEIHRCPRVKPGNTGSVWERYAKCR